MGQKTNPEKGFIEEKRSSTTKVERVIAVTSIVFGIIGVVAVVVVGLLIVSFLTGCAVTQDPGRVIPEQLRTGRNIDVEILRTYQSRDNFVSGGSVNTDDGVRVRVFNNTGRAYMVYVSCDFMKEDGTVLSPHPRYPNETTARLRMNPYIRRDVDIWSRQNSFEFYEARCRVTDDTELVSN